MLRLPIYNWSYYLTPEPKEDGYHFFITYSPRGLYQHFEYKMDLDGKITLISSFYAEGAGRRGPPGVSTENYPDTLRGKLARWIYENVNPSWDDVIEFV